MLAGYAHFLALAPRLQRDADEIDLRPDAAAWPRLPARLRARLETLIAGFALGEAGVAAELAPFAAAASDPLAARCFAAQQRDEARHSEFFARVAAEVTGGRGRLDRSFEALFAERLPAVARALARDPGSLGAAVGLYHMVLEGVVFTAGLLALEELLAPRADLPGLKRGAALVLRDARWHVGLGARCLQDARPDAATVAAILDEGERAASAWGGAARAAHAVAILRQRLKAVAAHAAAAPLQIG